MTDNNGLIVYFEGPDGVGKTTQLKLAAEALREKGHTVHETRAIGGTPIGEKLREAFLLDIPRPVETDLHIALACQFALSADVLERRKKGEIVLIDRGPLSILAYQVFGDGLDKELGYKFAAELFGLIKPDLTVTYRAADGTLVERREHRNQAAVDFFEAKSADYHHEVARGFSAGAEHFGAKIIDANASIDEIHDQTMILIDEVLKA